MKRAPLFVITVHNYCVMQDLYEVAYAFCPDFNMDAFNLYIMIPRQFVPFTDTCIGDSNFGLSPVFVIEEGTETVPFLSDEVCIAHYMYTCIKSKICKPMME